MKEAANCGGLRSINVDRRYRSGACNCSGTCYFFPSSFRRSVVCRQRDRKPTREPTKQRNWAMQLPKRAWTSLPPWLTD